MRSEYDTVHAGFFVTCMALRISCVLLVSQTKGLLVPCHSAHTHWCARLHHSPHTSWPVVVAHARSCVCCLVRSCSCVPRDFVAGV